jgi:hypothetical protein
MKKRKTAIKKTAPKRRRKSRTNLAAGLNNASMKASGEAIISGLIGGVAANYLKDSILSNQPPLNKMLALGGLAFVTGAMLRRPMVAAGIGAILGAELIKEYGTQKALKNLNTPLNDYKYSNELNNLPMMLNENGFPLSLADDTDYSELSLMDYRYINSNS